MKNLVVYTFHMKYQTVAKYNAIVILPMIIFVLEGMHIMVFRIVNKFEE